MHLECLQFIRACTFTSNGQSTTEHQPQAQAQAQAQQQQQQQQQQPILLLKIHCCWSCG